MKFSILYFAICWWHSVAGDVHLNINNNQQQPHTSAATPQNAQLAAPATVVSAHVGPVRVRANLKSTPNNVRYETRYTQQQQASATPKPAVLIAPGAEGLLPPHRSTAHFASRAAVRPQQQQQQQRQRQRNQNYQQLAARPRYVLLDSYQNPIPLQAPRRRVITVYPTTYQGRTHFVQRTPAQPISQQYYVAQRLTAARPPVNRHHQLNRTHIEALAQRLRGRYQNCEHQLDESYDQHDDVYDHYGHEEEHVDEDAHGSSESSTGTATVSDSSFSVSNSSVSVSAVESSASTSTSTSTTTTTTTTTTPAPVVKQYEIRRRPAIQQHFYDVEQKVIVRPVGSAVVELDHGDYHHHYPHHHHHNAPAPTPTPATSTPEPEPPVVPSTTTSEPTYTTTTESVTTNTPEPQPAETDNGQTDTEIVQPIPEGFPTHEESPASAPTVAYEQTAIASPDYDFSPQPADYHHHHPGIDEYGPSAGGPQFIPYPPVYGPTAHPVDGGYYPGEIDVGSYPDVQVQVPEPSSGYLPAAVSPQHPQPPVVYHHHHHQHQPTGFAGGVDESDYYGSEQSPSVQPPTPTVSTTPLPCPPADSELIDPQAAGTHPAQDPDTYDDGQRHQQNTNTDGDYDGSTDDYDHARGSTDDRSEVDALASPTAAPLKFQATIKAPTPPHQQQRSQPLVEIRSRGAAPDHVQTSPVAAPPPLAVVHNQTAHSGNRTNEQRLLDFYAVRGGVTEVDDHPAFTNGPTNGHQIIQPAAAATRTPLRARVISVTPAPDYEPGSEQSNVRRVVVSKSIETEERVEIGASKDELRQQRQRQQRQLRLDRLQKLTRSKVVEPRKY